MAVIGLDLGGTKLAAAIFDQKGTLLMESTVLLEGRQGDEVGKLITLHARSLYDSWSGSNGRITGIGICIPGIYHSANGTVWAPNIPGWEDYPLSGVLDAAFSGEGLTISIDSDRACYILGETWKGSAINSRDAIFLAIGTGIGAGIMCDGRILRGHGDIAGAAGWMALTPVYSAKYKNCGCFEYHTSGRGLVHVANEISASFCNEHNHGNYPLFDTASGIFAAYDMNDPVAVKTIEQAVSYWGMAAANLVSIFNPEIIVFGGGVFGPAVQFLDLIREEASKWAQPVSMGQVRFVRSSLGGMAGLAGAGKLALMSSGEEQ